MTRNLVAVLLPVLSLSLGLTVGCSGPNEPHQDEFLPQTSPENVIENLVLAYNQRNTSAYSALLAEDFVFEFGPEDGSPGIPPSRLWHLEEDSLSSRNLFELRPEEKPGVRAVEYPGPVPVRPATWGGIKAEYFEGPFAEQQTVLNVTLHLAYGASVPVNEPGHEEERTITAVTHLTVEQRGSLEGPITLVVSEDRAEFSFRKGRTPSDTDSNLWYIVRWKDRPE